jgi:hypothetical protein
MIASRTWMGLDPTKRLGLRMTRTGRSFCVIDATGELAVNSKPGMSLAEIEQWIASRARVRGWD